MSGSGRGLAASRAWNRHECTAGEQVQSGSGLYGIFADPGGDLLHLVCLHEYAGKAGQLWWGIPGSILILLLTFIAPLLVMKDKESPYPFEDRELYGYGKEHVMELWEKRKAEKAAKTVKEGK